MEQNQNPGNLEDQIRRMILLGGSAPNEDTTPKVRLPPPQNYPQHDTPIMQPFGYDQPSPAQQWPNGSPVSPASSRNQGFPPPPPPEMIPQDLPQQAHPSRHIQPPHMRHRQYQQHTGPPHQSRSYAPPPQLLHGVHMQGYQGQDQPPGHGPQRQQRRQQRRQQIQLEPDAFNRARSDSNHGRPSPQSRSLFDPNAHIMHPQYVRNEHHERQALYLQEIASVEVPRMEMSYTERGEKESFRQTLHKLCQDVCEDNLRLPKVSLECFGSFQSGFASAGSDMDLVIVVHDKASSLAFFSLMGDDLPRELERKLLRAGYGARLLTRTRVPIIKVCESPNESLLDKLRAEREKWDFLPNEKKYPHLFPEADDEETEDDKHTADVLLQNEEETNEEITSDSAKAVTYESKAVINAPSTGHDDANVVATVAEIKAETTMVSDPSAQASTPAKREQSRTWTRERKPGPLDFPKDGIGIQCDINFFNPLGLHNTHMLRCYSLCDPRVRPIVLFVKSWAKLRKINSSYSGTLSSYGYVLMVLHYLMNVAGPPVIPNLQAPWRPNSGCTPVGVDGVEVDGWHVDFWRNEDEIVAAVQSGQMSTNRETVGSLLLGFFQYYASQGRGPKFHWMNEVLSLRTPYGILTKIDKGWVKAITEEGEGKKIQHRYLFCIEDPFELSHNVARTVTHNGIVAIRDEFRRAYRILQAVAWGKQPQDGHLFSKIMEPDDFVAATAQLTLDNQPSEQDMVNRSTPQPEHNRQKKPFKQPHQKSASGAASHGRSQTQNLKAKPLDLADQEAFPSLGGAPTKKSRQNNTSISEMNGEGSITGEKAQVYLEEFRRKKAEQEAEHTAMGAAEAVLDGDD